MKYRKKPVIIEARQWDGTAEGATPIIDWIVGLDGTARFVDYDQSAGYSRSIPLTSLQIDTLEGTMHAIPNDMICRGTHGEFYPCRPDIFDACYEEVHPRYPNGGLVR